MSHVKIVIAANELWSIWAKEKAKFVKRLRSGTALLSSHYEHLRFLRRFTSPLPMHSLTAWQEIRFVTREISRFVRRSVRLVRQLRVADRQLMNYQHHVQTLPQERCSKGNGD